MKADATVPDATPNGGFTEEQKQVLFNACAQSVITNPLVKKLTDEMTDGGFKLNPSGES